MLICPHCTTPFTKTRHNQIYCSKQCKIKQMDKRKFQKSKLNKKFQCLLCQTPTNNPKYCSIKCAGKSSTANLLAQKQAKGLKSYYCSCGNLLRIGWKPGSKFCDNCKTNPRKNKNFVKWSSITIKDFKSKFKTIYQYNARIRSLARSSIKLTPCKNCGYNNHVEVCHIKPVKDFLDTNFISEVNDISNLVCLCPNCHWEFDNGLIKL